jgi:transcriptional regulator with GAF, ATPase, and Fis domain
MSSAVATTDIASGSSPARGIRLVSGGRPGSSRATPFEVVAAVAGLLGQTLELRQVCARVAEAALRTLSFDRMNVLLWEGAEGLRQYAVAATAGDGSVHEEGRLLRREDCSPRFWREFVVERIDARRELDAVFARDREILDAGIVSIVRGALRSRGRTIGVLAFYSRRRDAFTREDEPLVQALADLVAAALEHERRVADQVSLALAQERLAEEKREAGDARSLAVRLVTHVQSLTREIESLGGRRRIVGASRSWNEVLEQATQVAPTDTTVLLVGESGTGKEVIARLVHGASPRANGPYVAVNCAALPDQLLESELFGYEKGAFTGAGAAKPGQIERAARGVLLLDEVGEMSLAAQAKLLRVLQEKEFQRLGGSRVSKADVRIVAATNRDLRAAVENGTFREDLYYRLHVFEIRLPPLRERRDDILPLAEEFLAEIGRAFGRPPAGVSRDARARLLQYDWPGNVRELRNALERAAIVCEGGLINAEHLSLAGPRTGMRPAAGGADRVLPAANPATARDLRTIEREMVEKALEAARFNKSDAARALGLSRKQLYVRLRRFGLV